MDIRKVSEEEKQAHINKVKEMFGHIRKMLDQLEEDMPSKDLMTQATSVWIGSNLCTWYDDFIKQVSTISKAEKDRLENYIEGNLNDTDTTNNNEHTHNTMQ